MYGNGLIQKVMGLGCIDIRLTIANGSMKVQRFDKISMMNWNQRKKKTLDLSNYVFSQVSPSKGRILVPSCKNNGISGRDQVLAQVLGDRIGFGFHS